MRTRQGLEVAGRRYPVDGVYARQKFSLPQGFIPPWEGGEKLFPFLNVKMKDSFDNSEDELYLR